MVPRDYCIFTSMPGSSKSSLRLCAGSSLHATCAAHERMRNGAARQGQLLMGPGCRSSLTWVIKRVPVLPPNLAQRALACCAPNFFLVDGRFFLMSPMIAILEEVRRLRAVYAAFQHELSSEGTALLPGTQVGIMIETPVVSLMADVLAREVDFFSIGANVLFQYTMAADRTNSRVTAMFGELEPAVWRLIECVVRAGAEHGKLVAVCGELAADARIGPLLAGLGVQELSMSPPAIVKVKAALHKHAMDYWQRLARELLKAETAADVPGVLQSIE